MRIGVYATILDSKRSGATNRDVAEKDIKSSEAPKRRYMQKYPYPTKRVRSYLAINFWES